MTHSSPLPETFSSVTEMLANLKDGDSISLQIMQPEGMADCDFHFFQEIVKLVSHGINARDVRVLEEGGIYSYDGLMALAKKNVTGNTSFLGTKLNIICEAAEKIATFGHITGCDTLVNRKPGIHIASGSQAHGPDELLGGGIETGAITKTAAEFQSCKTQLACTLGISIKDLLGPSLHVLPSHGPRIGDDGSSRCSVDPQDMDETHVYNVDDVPAADDHVVPQQNPVPHGGHNGDDNGVPQLVPDVINPGGVPPPLILVFIDGEQRATLNTPAYMGALIVDLEAIMSHHHNYRKLCAIGRRITYWDHQLERLLVPITVDVNPWNAFWNSLARIVIESFDEP